MARLMTKQEFINKLTTKGRYDVELVGDYINTATNTLFRCTKSSCKYEWSPTPNQILSGGRCPACAGLEDATYEYLGKSEKTVYPFSKI